MKNLKANPYVGDILSQGESLKKALARFDGSILKPLADSLQHKEFDRIILTGMGGSYFASYPVWLMLADAGLPVILVDCAELIHHSRGLMTPQTLVWVASQSGRSAEIVAVLELIQQAGATLLATVNDPASPLAQAAGKNLILIHAEVENTVSTRTYINTLAVGQLAALYLSNGNAGQGLAELQATASGLEVYLADWDRHFQAIGERIPLPSSLILLGRGHSLAAANTGALILAEASKLAAIGMQAGEFRHGPLELASPDLTVVIFAGPGATQRLNARLYRELKETGARAIWVGPAEAAGSQPDLPMPPALGIGIPLAEILPIQLLTVHLAVAQNLEPGKFFRVGKVTLNE